MSWADLCGSSLTTGVSLTVNELYGNAADAGRLTRAGLPIAATLAKFASKAQGLKLQSTNKGIWFNIVTCALGKDGLSTSPLFNNSVIGKQGAAVCFEDKILPIATNVGVTILVHQSLVPCERCRSGYKAWAQDRNCTIVVSADGGYDQIPDNALFFFSPTGDVYYV